MASSDGRSPRGSSVTGGQDAQDGQDGIGATSRRSSSVAARERTFDTPGSSVSNRGERGERDDSTVKSTGNHEEGLEKKKQPVKRACNECRQQKLRCDVVQEPFTTCSRCRRLKLECKIESNFRRIGKRSRNAEMEREIIELRRLIANSNAAAAAAANVQYMVPHHQQISTPLNQTSPSIPMSYGRTPPDVSVPSERAHGRPGTLSSPQSVNQPLTNNMAAAEEYMRPHEVVTSLLDLRAGLDPSHSLRSPNNQHAVFKRIEDVSIAPERVTELFSRFFTFFHPFLPFLDKDKLPDEFYSTSPLLFWTIISVGCRHYHADRALLNALSGPVMRMVWSTLADVPQSYHIIKALALLCTWPFPSSSTSTDPTFMLCGMMMQIAMQIGLHRPSHVQDFSKFQIELREGELKDRVRTWAVCNIVAQRVATGYGQPGLTMFDWTLSSNRSTDPNFQLPSELKYRLDIEKFCEKVSKSLYSNPRDPVGLLTDEERFITTSILSRDFAELEGQLHSVNNPVTNVYLRAASLHLHLSAFFDSPTAKDYRHSLSALYTSATSFLESALGLETTVGPMLIYSPFYIFQMTLAAGFCLLKLCKSFFAVHIDMEYTRSLFNGTIRALRSMSVASNDLPERLAEVLAQMWRMAGSSQHHHGDQDELDNTLRLKVRCRMSMSLVYDSVWRWREDARARGRNIESYLKNPTNPDSAESSASSSVGPGAFHTSTSTPAISNTGTDPSLAPAPPPPTTGIGSGIGLSSTTTTSGGVNMNNLPSGVMELNYEVFDPLNWMLDGLIEFPQMYGSVGLEQEV